MATTEPLKIEQKNFNGSWAKEWSDSHGNKDSERRLFICAAAWYMRLNTTYNLFGSGEVQVYLSYWDGSSWSPELHVECIDNQTIMIGHNRDEGNLNYSLHNDYPLWRVRYWPSRENSRWSITVWAGGYGLAKTGATFWRYPKGKKIYSIGRSGDPLHATGATDEHPFNYLKRRGDPILAAFDHELISYPYLP